MGIKNTSETRVRPVFDQLLDRRWNDAAFAAAWLSTLWRLAEGMLRYPDSLAGAARQSTDFGCSGEALVWRRRLFGGDQAERAQAQTEGLTGA